MKMRSIIFIMIIVLFGSSLFSLGVINSQKVAPIDVVAINEAVKVIEEQWDQLDQIDLDSIVNLLDNTFSIINNNGNILFQADAGQSASIYDAIKNRHIIVDITFNESIVGKLLVHVEDKETVQQMKGQLSKIVILMMASITIICVIYIFYVYYNIIKPFNSLQKFATQVARGNLDLPLRVDKNNLFGAFTESFDILREELAAARQGEYESNKSKKELVATLSHDIKTPVASIKAVSELMLLQATDDKVRKQLTMINTKAEQIDLLITDMFHVTMEELQELKVIVTEESSRLVIDMVTNVNYQNTITCDQIPDCIITIDPNRLQQVLDNIFSNAYKYAGTSVAVTSEIIDEYLELNIMDYGPGISEDELPLLFNKFYRGTNVAGKSGSGLGLYISQHFMYKMNGEMICRNRVNGFTVTLRIKLA